jgi:ribosomal protein S18 acetylase RimI-like enzyme
VNGDLAGQTCFTDGFGVHHDYRGRGLARYAMLYSLSVMKEWGYRRATLGVKFDNHHALLLYDSVGYRKIFTQYALSRTLRD